MNIRTFISIGVSTLLFVVMGLIVMPIQGQHDRALLDAHRALLASQAKQLQAAIIHAGVGLSDVAVQLGSMRTMAASLRQYSVASKAATQKRMDVIRQRMRDDVFALHQSSDIHGKMTVITDQGIVAMTESDLFVVGQPLSLPKVKQDAPVQNEQDTEHPNNNQVAQANSNDNQPSPFVQGVLNGTLSNAITAARDGIYFFGVAQVKQKKKVLGSVIFEQPFASMPTAMGVSAFIYSGHRVLLGTTPKHATLEAPRGDGTYPGVVPIPKTDMGWLSLSMGPSDPKSDHPSESVWGQSFAIGNQSNAVGIVWIKGSPFYDAPFGVQLWLVLLLIVAWAIHVTMMGLGGVVLHRGIGRVSTFLSDLKQGHHGGSLSETSVPLPLRAMVGMLNSVVATLNSKNTHEPMLASAEVTDIFNAGAPGGVIDDDDESAPPDFSGLAFEGISNSGTVAPKGAKPPPPPVSDGYDDSVASDGAALFEVSDDDELGHEQDLPAVEDATEALDFLSANVQPHNTIPHSNNKPIGMPGDDLDEDVERMTTVMEVSPEFLSQLRDTDDTTMADAEAQPPENSSVSEAKEAIEDQTTVMKITPGILDQLQKKTKSPEPKSAQDTKSLLKDIESDHTGVMKITPELLAQLKTETEEAARAAKPNPAEISPVSNVSDLNKTGVMKLTPELLEQMRNDHAAPDDAPKAPPRPVVSTLEDTTDTHCREIFAEFTRTRTECGESGALVYDKFAKRLQQTRDAVIKKNKCKDVRFQVYIKANKAALKAVPVR